MKNSVKIAIFSLLLGVIVDILFFKTLGIGLNVVLVEIAFLGISYLLAYLTHHKLSLSVHASGVMSLGFALPIMLWTSDIGLTVALIGLLLTNVLFVAFLTGEDAHFRHPFELVVLYVPLVIKIVLQLPIFNDVFSKITLTEKGKRIVVGIVLLVPVLILFAGLFASADAVFNSYVNLPFTNLGNFLHIKNAGEAIAQIMIVMFVALIATLLFAAAFWNRVAPLEKRPPTLMGETESVVVLTGVILLFAAFLAVQGITMFGGEAAMRSLDLTYAEYARQGFNQLIYVGILVASLVLTLRYLHGEHAKKHLIVLHSLLIVETLLVLVSAFLRVNLYIDAYGFTPERLLAMGTIGTLGVLFLLLLANVVQRESQAHFVERGLIALGVCGIIFCLSGPDAMAANFNVRRAENGKPIDLELLSKLSADADPALLHALNLVYEGKIVSEKPTNQLIYACRFVAIDSTGEPLTDWRVWNLARLKAGYIVDDINNAIAVLDSSIKCVGPKKSNHDNLFSPI